MDDVVAIHPERAGHLVEALLRASSRLDDEARGAARLLVGSDESRSPADS